MARAIDFSGAAGTYIDFASGIPGSVDAKAGTISFWFNIDVAGTAYIYNTKGTATNTVLMLSSYLELSEKDSGGTFAYRANTSGNWTPSANTGAWHHILASWDVASSVGHTYIDGADVENQTAMSDRTIQYSASPFSIGGYSGGLNFNGKIAEFYFNDAEYIDITQASNRAKFYNAGAAVDLGVDGSTPTGNAPVLYLGFYDDTATNLGTGGGTLSEHGGVSYTDSGPTGGTDFSSLLASDDDTSPVIMLALDMI